MPGVMLRESSSDSSPPSTQGTPKKQRTPKKEKGDADKPKQQRKEWTADEDTVFLELINKVLKDQLFAEVKSDGRLDRGSSAVTAHLKSVMNKLKRSG